MKIGNAEFKDYTYVMAIINLTPDSFWKESRKTCDEALFAVEKAINEGASIIDLGAQSTRPGYTEVSAEEEISRFERPLMLVKERFDIPVSLDTYFAESAKIALAAGSEHVRNARPCLRRAGRGGAAVRDGRDLPRRQAGQARRPRRV